MKERQLISALSLLLLITCISLRSLYADILTVPRNYQTIQGAINQTQLGDTVLVSPGRYNENITFGGRALLLTSLIMLDDDAEFIERTIIDGGGESVCLAFTEGEDENTIVRGFTLTNGWQNFGGGIDCQDNTSPILEDLLVTGNEVAQIGGGIYCTWSSTPTFRNVIVENNTATDGAGIGLAHDCHPIFSNVIIRDNEAERYGGGVFAGHGDGEGTFENVTIENNTALIGGGAYFEWTQNVIFNDVQFIGNIATEEAGGIYSNSSDFSLNACEITGSEGDAIVLSVAEVTIESCDLSDNDGVGITSEESIINLSSTQLRRNLSGIIVSYSVLRMNLCEITECDSLAISVFDSSVVVIDSSEIINNAGAGMVIDSSIVSITVTNINGNLFGIFASDSDLNLLNCRIAGSDSFGISVEDSSVVRIEATEINGNAGIGMLADSSVVSLVSTDFDQNVSGIFASYSDIGLLVCQINGSDDFGISVEDSSVVQIDSSSFTWNDGGAMLADSSTVTINVSYFAENAFGINASRTELTLLKLEFWENLGHGVSILDSSVARIDSSQINAFENAIVAVSSMVEIIGTVLDGGESGIDCSNSVLNLTDCEVSNNPEYGIWVSGSSIVDIKSCTISENEVAGLGARNSVISVTLSEITENGEGVSLDSSQFSMSHSTVSRNIGGGIFSNEGGLMILDSCIISENNLEIPAPGLAIGGISLNTTDLIARNCVIRGNNSEYGGAMSLGPGKIEIYDSYIYDNTGNAAGAIFSMGSDVTCINTSIIDNLRIDRNPIGGGYVGIRESKVKFINSIIWGNQQIPIATFMEDGQEIPEIVIVAFSDVQGGIDSVGGDGEIIWLDGNIDADPLFAVMDDNGHSFMPDSPCIDAGTAFFVYEGDTLVNLAEDEYLDDAPDMGAFEREHNEIDDDGDIPENYALMTAYPNPFNSSLTIVINLEAASFSRMTIYDLRGREVAVLQERPLPKGIHSFVWKASGYAPGIYIAQLATPAYSMRKKVILLK